MLSATIKGLEVRRFLYFGLIFYNLALKFLCFFGESEMLETAPNDLMNQDG